MTGGDDPPLPSPPPPNNGGEFLLRLVQNRHQQPPQQPPPSHLPDPAVAAVGPTLPIPFPSNHHHHNHRLPFSLSPQSQNPNFSFQQQQFYQSSPPTQTPSFHSSTHQHFDHFCRQQQPINWAVNNNGNNSSSLVEEESLRLKKLELELNLIKERELGFALGSKTNNGFASNRGLDPPRFNSGHHGSSNQQYSGPPPGFSSKTRNHHPEVFNNAAFELNNSPSEFELKWNHSNSNNHLHVFGSGSNSTKNYEKERRFSSRDSRSNDNSSSNVNGVMLSGQLDHPGLPSGSNLNSVPASDIEVSLRSIHSGVDDNEVGHDDIDDLSEQLVDSVLGEDQSDEKNDVGGKKKHHRDKDFRSDSRGKWILSQRMRNSRRLIECRRDIDRLDSQFLAIYESLIPVEEEIAKQKRLLTLLEQLVCKEWPNAKLYLYGSCANSFGVLKSDIDVCLAIDDQDINKSEMLLKLADILRSGNLQDVQALTRARVPIVKLMDPVTGISCDICINNVLAVVNTKLLRDYAEIDVRLRQLAFLVKHWAKSRGVNETYQGTLSSYAYVLMCIHFLQLRNPPILPCLQNMKTTYAVTVDDIECTFFDQVEKLRNFGARNKENISKLLWGFFSYWAYCHDYANQVISIRSGCILSKLEKNWTRRVGNDRHLICIEDPFETSHDLGRVVDKHSIRVLREEFERAAEIMQYDPNPCVALFEPYIRR